MGHIAKDFLAKAKSGDLVIGIVGLGYVGLPLAEAFVPSPKPLFGSTSKSSAMTLTIPVPDN